MTHEEAQKILDLHERARLSISTHGEVPADWIAREYNVTRGEGLSLFMKARRVLDGTDNLCPSCRRPL